MRQDLSFEGNIERSQDGTDSPNWTQNSRLICGRTMNARRPGFVLRLRTAGCVNSKGAVPAMKHAARMGKFGRWMTKISGMRERRRRVRMYGA